MVAPNIVSELNHNRLNTLEKVCNKAAARILLPTDLLRAELKSDPFDPQVLRRLADKAAFLAYSVNRIKEVGAWVDQVGVVAYVEQAAGAFCVQGGWYTCGLRHIFRRLWSEPRFGVYVRHTNFISMVERGSKSSSRSDAKRSSARCSEVPSAMRNPESRAQHEASSSPRRAGIPVLRELGASDVP